MRPSSAPSLALCAAVAAALVGLSLASNASAFTHIVQPGETLASIAERIYGRIQHERILVAANELDVQGGLSIVAGMRLEVPSVAYRRVRKGDTWQTMATEHLGTPKRADVLAISNGTNPWLPAEEGAEITIPYNLRLIATAPDTLPQVAYRYLGDTKKAWMLEQYNGAKGIELRRGDVVLVPLTDLPLTEEGRREAAAAGATEATEDSAAKPAPANVESPPSSPRWIADVARGGLEVRRCRSARQRLPRRGRSHHAPSSAVINRLQLLETPTSLWEPRRCSWLRRLRRSAKSSIRARPSTPNLAQSRKILRACQHRRSVALSETVPALHERSTGDGSRRFGFERAPSPKAVLCRRAPGALAAVPASSSAVTEATYRETTSDSLDRRATSCATAQIAPSGSSRPRRTEACVS